MANTRKSLLSRGAFAISFHVLRISRMPGKIRWREQRAIRQMTDLRRVGQLPETKPSSGRRAARAWLEQAVEKKRHQVRAPIEPGFAIDRQCLLPDGSLARLA